MCFGIIKSFISGVVTIVVVAIIAAVILCSLALKAYSRDDNNATIIIDNDDTITRTKRQKKNSYYQSQNLNYYHNSERPNYRYKHKEPATYINTENRNKEAIQFIDVNCDGIMDHVDSEILNPDSVGFDKLFLNSLCIEYNRLFKNMKEENTHGNYIPNTKLSEFKEIFSRCFYKDKNKYFEERKDIFIYFEESYAVHSPYIDEFDIYYFPEEKYRFKNSFFMYSFADDFSKYTLYLYLGHLTLERVSSEFFYIICDQNEYVVGYIFSEITNYLKLKI